MRDSIVSQKGQTVHQVNGEGELGYSWTENGHRSHMVTATKHCHFTSFTTGDVCSCTRIGHWILIAYREKSQRPIKLVRTLSDQRELEWGCSCLGCSDSRSVLVGGSRWPCRAQVTTTGKSSDCSSSSSCSRGCLSIMQLQFRLLQFSRGSWHERLMSLLVVTQHIITSGDTVVGNISSATCFFATASWSVFFTLFGRASGVVVRECAKQRN